MNHDYHAHSNYSDGEFLWSMISAAEEAGLDGIGFADHCNVWPDEEASAHQKAMGFNLDITYDRRRDAIEYMRDQFDLRVYDAVEIDYHPDYESATAEFLDEAGFDYAIGSVHDLEDANVHFQSHFSKKSDEECAALVDRYYDKLVPLVESELFDIAAHLDLVERNPLLRGYSVEDHYRRVAEAFTSSSTVPEINAGRVFDEYGKLHPTSDFVDVLLEYDIEFVLGSDSHEPEAIAPRKAELETFVTKLEVPITTLDL